jgi:hypothetical protein
MKERLSVLRGGPVRARDGDIGTIRDFYFDDEAWTVRFAVVDAGKWLPGRQVLIPLWALEAPEWSQARVPVRLTREQVKQSPDVDSERPVSRRIERSALGYYGYPVYWTGPALWGPVAAPGLLAELPPPAWEAGPEDDETHLRSCNEVRGYHIHARDGAIGHVDDFVVDDATWTIERLLLDTSNWIGGRAVLIPRTAVEDVSWADARIVLAMTRDEIARSPAPAA